MAFSLKRNPTFTVPVTIPGADEPLRVIYKRLPQTDRAAALEAFQTKIESLKPKDGEEAVMKTREVIDAQVDFLIGPATDGEQADGQPKALGLVAGWEDCEEEFNRESLFDLLDEYDTAFEAIAGAYRAEGEKAAAGN